jgi:hypothetical protein
MAQREFTRGEILLIREMAAKGNSAPTISKLFPEVSVETLRRIIRGETYREIGQVAPELERPAVRGRLEGEATPEAKTALERAAMESLAALTQNPPSEEVEPDPVQAFLGVRRGDGTTKG